MNNKEDIYKILGASNHAISERAKDDFYSTPPEAVEALLNYLPKINVNLPNLIIEPGVGNGAIAYPLSKSGFEVIPFDIVDRGYPNTIILDWLKVKARPEVELAIIANFPYKNILKHTEVSLNILNDGEYLIELTKIQFLEGLQRRELFDRQPPKFVLVFSKRIKCLTNGIDDGNSSAICFIWTIFEKGFKGMPMIGWL